MLLFWMQNLQSGHAPPLASSSPHVVELGVTTPGVALASSPRIVTLHGER